MKLNGDLVLVLIAFSTVYIRCNEDIEFKSFMNRVQIKYYEICTFLKNFNLRGEKRSFLKIEKGIKPRSRDKLKK